MSTSTSTFTAGDSEPVDADPGDIWFDSTIGKTFVNYSGTWVEIGNAATVVDVIADADADTKVQVEVTADSDKIEFTTDGTKRLEIDASGHVIPAANETYDLGSASNRFRDLYLSGSSIDLGGVSITSDGSNISLPNVDDIAASSVTIAGENVTPYTGRRNLLYNGAMQVAQRGTSATGITSTGYKTVDRWNNVISGAGTWTETVESDAPDGFSNSVKFNCTTANASLAAGAYFVKAQSLEGRDLQCLAKGTSSAKPFTATFWVKSNVTGTYIVEFIDNDSLRRISASYTISSSGSWEKKTILIPGDTIGQFDNDNNTSLVVQWWLAVGSDRSGGSSLNTSWAIPSTADRAVGQTNLASAVNNYWQITGVQLEVGDKATPFEHRSYGEELALCQRYYYQVPTNYYGAIAWGHTIDANPTVRGNIIAPVTMRATPTITTSSTVYIYANSSSRVVSSIGVYTAGGGQVNCYFNYSGTGYPGGSVCSVMQNGGTFELSAEL